MRRSCRSSVRALCFLFDADNVEIPLSCTKETLISFFIIVPVRFVRCSLFVLSDAWFDSLSRCLESRRRKVSVTSVGRFFVQPRVSGCAGSVRWSAGFVRFADISCRCSALR